MALIEINRDPSPRELRWFGAIFAAFFALVGGLLWWKFDAPRAARIVWTVAAVVAVLYYLAPPLRRWLYLGWMYAAFPLGWLISHAILGLVYYVVLTPIGLVMRLVGYDPMHRAFDASAGSYWIARRTESDPGRYFKQF